MEGGRDDVEERACQKASRNKVCLRALTLSLIADEN